MKPGHVAYVDFNRFCPDGRNRDLLASPGWQRIVHFLAASLGPNPPRPARPAKPSGRR